ncbi:uncharacterized protein B0J16DRAFT_411406 [Fusarium flagelliforme]|uniref:uncharacterized protein n=1 Tax=Fusarium flagelliforme TaxID=2675880 RepID=UPI001E8D8E0A|nr:uncharacterized protein B0J16DRAFT_411406 [Fusarium flagelliforme]KAH7192724.1 hypothetical protein B0J16DRAFT_411406 [Fusarium flagelliforme]
MMNVSPLPPTPVNEFIGFRVECQSATHGTATRHLLNNNGGIYPDVFPAGYNFWDKADDHMSWRRVNSPFVSFFRTWERAMYWRENLIRNRGGRGIRIIAVWLKGLTKVYDAYTIASHLGYPRGPRRILEHHRHELLVEGGIHGDDYRVLAIFNGYTLGEEDIGLRPLAIDPERGYRATIPRGSLPGATATESLRDEMYSLTGTSSDFKLYLLVLEMGGFKYICEQGPGGITTLEETLYSCNHNII